RVRGRLDLRPVPEREVDVTSDRLERVRDLVGVLRRHRVRRAVRRVERRGPGGSVLTRSSLLRVRRRDRLVEDLHDVLNVRTHTRLGRGSVRTLKAGTDLRVAKILRLPLKRGRRGLLPATQATGHGQKRGVGGGERNQLTV